MKKNIILFIIFVIFNIMILKFDIIFEPFYSLEKILIPIDNNSVVFSYLLLNYAIILIYILSITKNLDELFQMYSFISSRGNRTRIAYIYLFRNFKITFKITIIKLIADIICGQLNKFDRLGILFQLYVSTFLTTIIWILLVTILFLIFQNQKKVLFSSLIVTYASQYITLKFNILPFFSIAGIGFYSHFILIIINKILLLIILFVLYIYLFKKIEVLGGNKND